MSNLNILIVDDNRDLADGLAFVLEDEGHLVTVAYSGEDAVKQSEKHQFDLVFMDVKLPGIDGIEAFCQIHKLRPETRVIIMTGFRIEQLLERAIDHGVARVLHKPFAINHMQSAIHQLGNPFNRITKHETIMIQIVLRFEL